MLIESIRKVWFTIVTNKIKAKWETHNILEKQQYAYRRGRRCSNCILQLINIMEHAEETQEEIFISSWDIRRAFDSVSRPMILLALERLGVPRIVAEKIAWLDNNENYI